MPASHPHSRTHRTLSDAATTHHPTRLRTGSAARAATIVHADPSRHRSIRLTPVTASTVSSSCASASDMDPLHEDAGWETINHDFPAEALSPSPSLIPLPLRHRPAVRKPRPRSRALITDPELPPRRAAVRRPHAPDTSNEDAEVSLRRAHARRPAAGTSAGSPVPNPTSAPRGRRAVTRQTSAEFRARQNEYRAARGAAKQAEYDRRDAEMAMLRRQVRLDYDEWRRGAAKFEREREAAQAMEYGLFPGRKEDWRPFHERYAKEGDRGREREVRNGNGVVVGIRGGGGKRRAPAPARRTKEKRAGFWSCLFGR